jgi:hypothetical protein
MRASALSLATIRVALMALVSAGLAWGGAACSSFSEGEAAPDTGMPDASGPVDLDAEAPDTAVLPDSGRGPSAVTVLASGFTGLAGVAATEEQVYFVERSTGIVHAVPLGGGATTDFAREALLPSPAGVVVSGGLVLWIDPSARMVAYRGVTGTTTSVLTVSDSLWPRSIATSASAGAPQIVMTVSDQDESSGGSVLELSSFASAPTYVASSFGTPFDVALLGKQVVWTDKSIGEVWAAELGGSGGAAFAMGELACESIAIDAEGIYWTKPAEGAVRMALSPTAAPPTSLASGELKPFSLVADASGVYWMTEDGKLRRSTRSELPLQSVADGFASVFPDHHMQAVALTSKYVVWITSDGKVLRHDK